MKIESFFDFCSGIGAGRLGLENCGLKCIGYADTSRSSVKTYNLFHDTSNEKNLGNIEKIDGKLLPKYDLLIAGFPCQTFSVIGRQTGFSEDRGQLIFHLIRLIGESRPKCFVLENVRGLVSHDKGKSIKRIVNELEATGYYVTYKILSSINYGVPQMRQRVYIIGFKKEFYEAYNNFCWPEEMERPLLKDYLIDQNNEISEENYNRFSYYLKNQTNVGKYIPEEFLDKEYLVIDTRMSDLRLYEGRVPTLRSHRDGIYYIRDAKIRELTGYEALLLQGFPKEYADKVKNEVTNRRLLMQAGNAMTVNMITALGNSILNSLEVKMGWKEFEQECYNYLQKKYSNEEVLFIKLGEEDSTKPDILVSLSADEEFYIETKEAKAQCGQFVLLPNDSVSVFEYSPRNKSLLDTYSSSIIYHMNNRYNQYRNAGTRGVSIDLDQMIFVNWIKNYYGNKGVKFFITKGSTGYIIFPLEKFEKYFDVTAKYREKKSGSAKPSKNDLSIVERILVSNYVNDYAIRFEGKKMHVTTEKEINKMQVEVGEYAYLFKKYANNDYIVTRLSNTYNSNVIFSISLKNGQDIYDLKYFENTLEKVYRLV